MHPLNERQQALIEDARRFASENIQILDSGDDRTAAAARLYRAFARGGYHALLIPEDLGGKGLDYVSTGLVYEALSYHLPATLHGPITTAHCIEMIRIGCQGARRDEILSAIASKGMAVGFCLTEEGAGSDIASISTRAERSGRGFTITGNKSIVIKPCHRISAHRLCRQTRQERTRRPQCLSRGCRPSGCSDRQALRDTGIPRKHYGRCGVRPRAGVSRLAPWRG